jgi:hypothetical protein
MQRKSLHGFRYNAPIFCWDSWEAATYALCLCPNKNSGHRSFNDALYCAISTSTVTGLMNLRIERPHMFQEAVILPWKSNFHFVVASLCENIGL